MKTLGKVGVAAIGIVYLLLAWIALQVAFGGSDQPADNSGALQEIAEKPFGKVLLAVMAVGLACFAIWQFVEAAIGYEEKDGKEKIFKRAGAAAKGLFGVALGLQSLKLALGNGSKSSSQKQKDWTSNLLELPAGRVLVVIIGLAVIAFAGYLAYKGVKKKFLPKIGGGDADAKVIKLGQVGYIARGVAFGVLGILVVVAGVKSQPEKSRGLDGALKALAEQPYGKWILILVALGLAAYGVFQLVTARHRREG
ncbi:MAG TPA: DUF1206 domain-containing protein [Kineosporiaceae bacterium]|nr:DUF1206 domain-containing protein [Kineosporiaceae bacterium]